MRGVNKIDHNFKSVKFDQFNEVIMGRPLLQTEGQNIETSKTRKMYVYKSDSTITSCWQLISIFARIKFLITGKIYLTIISDQMSPMAITSDNPIEDDDE